MAAKWTKSTQPRVVTDALLRDCALRTYCEMPEAARLVKEDGLEFSKIELLNLEFKGILKISNLWDFTTLKKLQLSNNVIEDITGLESLVNLTYLDLSYNHIEAIAGLENLVNLTDLSLTNNKIKKVENLDYLKKLQILSVKNNLIDDFNSVTYLYRFDNLMSLALCGNPIAEHKDYRPKKTTAGEQYKYEIEKLDDEMKLLLKQDSKSVSDELYLDSDEFLENLNIPEFFESIISSDPKIRLLFSFPGFADIFNEFYSSFTSLCSEWKQQGMRERSQRRQEIYEFTSCAERLISGMLKEARSKVLHFAELKQHILFEITLLDQGDKQSEKKLRSLVATLNEEIAVLWRTLMTLEMELDEKLDKILELIEVNLVKLLDEFAPTVKKFCAQVEDLDDTYVERTAKYFLDWCRKSNEEKQLILRSIQSDLDPDLLSILKEKPSALESIMDDGLEQHGGVIQMKQLTMLGSLNTWLAHCLNEYQEAKLEQHRLRVIEIVLYCKTAQEEVHSVCEYCQLAESAE